MQALERGQLWLMIVRAGLFGLILLMLGSGAARAAQLRAGVPPFVIIGPLLLLVGYLVIVAPLRRYRAWAYRMASDELELRRGVWTRVETAVPLGRVQHIDIAQGPLERAFAVCRLFLHTAGTAHSLVVLPGLSRATAEAMRDEIRARIRAEEE